MADKDNKETAPIGKRYASDRFPPVTTPEAVDAAAELQKKYDKDGAISIDVYFVQKGVRDPVAQAGMRAYGDAAVIKRATFEDWDEIFKTY